MNKQGEKGFTLIELLVVIAIIGLLSSVVFASLTSARSKARDAKRIAELRQIQLALELYFDDHGNYPQARSFSPWNGDTWINSGNQGGTNGLYNALVGGGYMSRLPTDPVNKEGTLVAGTGYYLADNAPTDLGYVYDSSGNGSYVLGTNLETVLGTANELGNYRLTNQ